MDAGDPFADVWRSEVVPQLVADTDRRLQVLTLFRALCRRHPGRFSQGSCGRCSGGFASGECSTARSRGVLRPGGGAGPGSDVRLGEGEDAEDAADAGGPVVTVDVVADGGDRRAGPLGGRQQGEGLQRGAGGPAQGLCCTDSLSANPRARRLAPAAKPIRATK